MAKIHIPTPLRAFTEGQATVEMAGATVGQALAALAERHPGLVKHLRDGEGRLRSFVNVYVGDEDIRYLDGEATTIAEGAEVTIVPSIAGGVG